MWPSAVLAALGVLAAVVWPSLELAERSVDRSVEPGGMRNQASGAGRARRSAAWSFGCGGALGKGDG